MMIAAVYARKSTDQSGVADEQKSVARQIEHARQYAARKGWTIADEHVYVDDGISGAEFAARPSFLRLMNALKPRPAFQVLVMSEESRLGREQIEVSYALKQIVTAGVRVFFYLDNRERTLDSPTDKIMLSLATFADELEREKARQRTYDAMQRKARAGHLTGGRCYGYDNVDVPGQDGRRAYVVQKINETEAAIVRRIFELAAAGVGFKTIAKQLNDERAKSPRAQRGRSNSWTPSTVREVLHRETYRGRRIWNRSRKRDQWGQKRQHDRPRSEWLTVEVEDLRIVAEPLWLKVHNRIRSRRAAGDPNAYGRGVRKRYFLTGFGRCEGCGGSIQAVSRASGQSRLRRYVCGTYWNRGCSVCANGRMVEMPIADRAVHELIRHEVLKPRVIERALDLALNLLGQHDKAGPNTREALKRRLIAIETELANLAETAARGGAVPTVLDALARRDEERRRLTVELAALQSTTQRKPLSRRASRDELRGFLADWSGLLTDNMSEARPVLDLVLAGQRIRFSPTADGQYELHVPIAFDRVLSAAIPALRGLQDMVTSPTGFDHILRANYRLVVRPRDRVTRDRAPRAATRRAVGTGPAWPFAGHPSFRRRSGGLSYETS
jgi:site-specific DNA recombinase